MRMRLLLTLLATCLMAQAQSMTVARLMEWLRNPAAAKESDAVLAGFLAKVKLSDRLDDSAIESLRGAASLGPKTLEALHRLRDQSRNLPEATAPAPVSALRPPPVPTAEEQAAILEDVRKYALDYSQKLPDFVCLEMERRFQAPLATGRAGAAEEAEWRQVDSITKRLTYFQQREQEKVIEHNRAYTTQDMKSLGGSQSFGDFGTMMRQIFEPATAARFAWAGWFRLGGGQVAMGFDFSVPLERSQYHLQVEKQDIITAYHGRVNVDPKTHAILRVKVEAENIPPDFPLRSASDVLYYENQTIADQAFLLPSQVEVRMCGKDYQSRNVKEYQAYRKYSAESSISFDDPPASTSSAPADKARETALPGQPAGKKGP